MTIGSSCQSCLSGEGTKELKLKVVELLVCATAALQYYILSANLNADQINCTGENRTSAKGTKDKANGSLKSPKSGVRPGRGRFQQEKLEYGWHDIRAKF